MDCKMIAFDLDGSFLDDEKQISAENLSAIVDAAEKGVHIVPATGRIYKGIPPELRELPFIRYYITVNGALVYDEKEDAALYSSEIPAELALEIMDYAEKQQLSYDCYQDNRGLMTATMLDNIGDYVDDPGILKLIRSLRSPVASLPDFIRDYGKPLQKLQLYTTDTPKKQRIMDELRQRYPELCVTSSVRCNIELNGSGASKGQALENLCRHLGLSVDQVIAFGDGSNDKDMLQISGLGIAMGNASPDVKAAADAVTLGNNQSGVAAGIQKYL